MAKEDTKTNKIERTKKALIEALDSCLGNVTEACKKIGVGRTTFYEYVKSDEEFAEKVEEIKEIALDFVEGKLLELIRGQTYVEITTGENEKGSFTKEVKKIVLPDTTATIFYLKTKGKHRGYIERQEVTGADGKDLYKPLQYDNLTLDELRRLKEIADKLEGDTGGDS